MISIPSKDLRDALNAGRRATAQVKGATPTVLLYTAKEDVLTVAFISDTVLYAERIRVKGELRKVYIESDVITKILAKREEDVRLKADTNKLVIKSKNLDASVSDLSVDEDDMEQITKGLFKKPNADTIDISPLVNAPDIIKKVFRSIKDNIQNSVLSTTAQWKGKELKVLISDAFHGIVLTAKLDSKVNSAELTLPVDAFLVALDIKEGSVYTDEATCTVLSKTKYLRVSLKETMNNSITFDVVENLVGQKSKARTVLDNAKLMSCIESCRSVADKSSGLVLDSDGKKVKVTMSGPGGKISELMHVQEKASAMGTVHLNVVNLVDVLQCMGNFIAISKLDSALIIDWSVDNIFIKGMCSTSNDSD